MIGIIASLVSIVCAVLGLCAKIIFAKRSAKRKAQREREANMYRGGYHNGW